MEWLKGLEFKHWWHVLVAAGIVVFVAGMTANLVPVFQAGFGLILFGVGEWINHPRQEQIGNGFKIVGYPRRFSILGSILFVLGAVFFGYGAFRLLLL